MPTPTRTPYNTTWWRALATGPVSNPLAEGFTAGYEGREVEPEPGILDVQTQLARPMEGTSAASRLAAEYIAALIGGGDQALRYVGSGIGKLGATLTMPEPELLARAQAKAAPTQVPTSAPKPGTSTPPPTAPPKPPPVVDPLAFLSRPSDQGSNVGGAESGRLRAFRSPTTGKVVFTNIEGGDDEAKGGAAELDYQTAVRDFNKSAAATSPSFRSESGMTQMTQEGPGTFSQSPLTVDTPGYAEILGQRAQGQLGIPTQIAQAQELLREAQMTPEQRATEVGTSKAQTDLAEYATLRRMAEGYVDKAQLAALIESSMKQAGTKYTPEMLQKATEQQWEDEVTKIMRMIQEFKAKTSLNLTGQAVPQ